MKFSTLAIVATTASAANFPSFDSFHAHCQFDTVVSKSCDETFNTLQGVLTEFSSPDFKDPSKGFYAQKQVANGSQLWFTRLGAGKKYTDDMEFLLSADPAGCKVTGKSQSQSLSYYDFYTNYCNMYNPLRVSGLTFTEPKTSQCKYAADPKQREAQCDAY